MLVIPPESLRVNREDQARYYAGMCPVSAIPEKDRGACVPAPDDLAYYVDLTSSEYQTMRKRHESKCDFHKALARAIRFVVGTDAKVVGLRGSGIATKIAGTAWKDAVPLLKKAYRKLLPRATALLVKPQWSSVKFDGLYPRASSFACLKPLGLPPDHPVLTLITYARAGDEESFESKLFADLIRMLDLKPPAAPDLKAFVANVLGRYPLLSAVNSNDDIFGYKPDTKVISFLSAHVAQYVLTIDAANATTAAAANAAPAP